jgi:hypothetical protein
MTASQLDLLAPTASQEPIDESHEVGGPRPGNPAVPAPLAGSPHHNSRGSGPNDQPPTAPVSPPLADLPAPVLASAPTAFSVGDRIAVHADGYRDGEIGTVTGFSLGYHHCLLVDLDSGEGAVFAPEELEHIPHD